MTDNHNSFQMHPISMEETWTTMRWANRMFCFLLAVTTVNIQNAAVYFLNKPKMDAMQSRRSIAKQLIFNNYLVEEKLSKKRPRWASMEQSLIMVPKYKQIIQRQLVPCKMKYGKWKCSNCSKFVHSYCTCTPGLMFCVDCFANHRLEVATAQSLDTQFGI